MAMKKCKECGQDISSSARVCPHCGKKLRNGCVYNLFLWVIVIVFTFVVGRWIFSQYLTNKDVGKEIVEQGFTLKVLSGSDGMYDIMIPEQYKNLEDMVRLGEVIKDKYKGQPLVYVNVYVKEKAKDSKVGYYSKSVPLDMWMIYLDGAEKPPTKVIKY